MALEKDAKLDPIPIFAFYIWKVQTMNCGVFYEL